MTGHPRRVTLRWASVALLGAFVLAAASVWSAADYNAHEAQFGEGEVGALPLQILLTGAMGTALMIIGAAGLLIAYLSARLQAGGRST